MPLYGVGSSIQTNNQTNDFSEDYSDSFILSSYFLVIVILQIPFKLSGVCRAVCFSRDPCLSLYDVIPLCLSTEHRCVESAKIRNKYPDRVPVSIS